MAHIKTIAKISIRANGYAEVIEKNTYINVTDQMAIYLCNEDIEALSLDEQKRNRRTKKAIRTPSEDLALNHADYTHL